MAIPITLAIGLLVAAVYVGSRILAPSAHATSVVIVRPVSAAERAVSAAQKPSPFAVTAVETSATKPVEIAKPTVAIAKTAVAIAPNPTVAIGKPDAVSAKAEVPAAKPEAPAAKPEIQPRGSGDSPVADSQDPGLIAPRPGERYLQIAAISSHMVPSFLAGLKKYNVQASIAPGPHDGLVRVVIGPFPSRDSVSSAKDQIQAQWPDCFVRLY